MSSSFDPRKVGTFTFVPKDPDGGGPPRDPGKPPPFPIGKPAGQKPPEAPKAPEKPAGQRDGDPPDRAG